MGNSLFSDFMLKVNKMLMVANSFSRYIHAHIESEHSKSFDLQFVQNRMVPL